ncbi:FtsW/RodA/SpoVE family cell cycle protein [Tissierella praeacuta]|uniref:FtsW/RodA/SpoVE family cell cycle protein n=1 Tax=Tissierella praeacuta TaxID=43131 RepID=UPI0033405CF6
MEQSNKIKEYLKTVCEQIRWKKAHEIISEEIEDHIVDQKETFLAEGLSDEEATNRAILEMGDPVIVGTELDSVYRPKPEWGIVILTGIMLILGVLIRAFVTHDVEMPWRLNNIIIHAVIGMAFMVAAYFIDFSIIGKYPKIIYFGLIILTMGTVILGPMICGQNFYLKFIMLLYPTAFAGILYTMRNERYIGIILSGVYCIIPGIICLSGAGLSSLALYLITCFILLIFAIMKCWFKVKRINALLLVCIPMIIVLIVTVLSMNGHQLWRIKTAFNPSLDPLGLGYQGYSMRTIIKNANFIGHNIQGVDTNDILPYPYMDTEYLLTHLIDKMGWISFIVIMSIILTFIIRSLRFSLNQKGVLGGLVSMSVIINFTMQVLLYVLYNLGFQLIVPLTLPLISYGGISTVINMFLIGIMLSVYKSGALYKKDDNLDTSKSKIFQFVDGKIIINLERR